MLTDRRVVYAANCSWWDGIEAASRTASGLPCCPWCGSVLFEVESEEEWWAGVERYAQNKPGYRELVGWSRGKCFPSHEHLEAAYVEACAI